MPGKVAPDDLLEHVFTRTGVDDEAVLQGPADGEDAAAIDPPAGTLVVSSDPISLAASDVGTLGVHVAGNDVAASGADPRWLTVVCMLPDRDALEPIVEDLDAAARSIGASIVGGHSEYVDALDRPLLALTAMGVTDRFVPTGGAEPGDRLLLTKGAAIEGTAILASDFGASLGVDDGTVERARAFLAKISVVPDARALRDHASAMHDPTEGGVAAAALEIARASDVRVSLERNRVPIREETRTLCEAAGVDPLRIFGSGALLATVAPDRLEDARRALERAAVPFAVVGEVDEGEPALALDGESIAEPIEDDLYPLWASADGVGDEE